MSLVAQHAMDVSQELLASAEAFVKEELATVDGSHDFFHVARVRASAKARQLGNAVPSHIFLLD